MVWRMVDMVCTTVYSFLQPIEKVGRGGLWKEIVYLGNEKRDKASCIHLFLGGFAKVCFGYKQVGSNLKRIREYNTIFGRKLRY